MRRLTSLVLIAALALALPGCSLVKDSVKDPIIFYYQRADFLYGETDSVIASETREASGHAGDLYYLLSLYLAGPLDEGLTCPFPRGTKLLSVQQEDNTLLLEISNTGDTLSASRFSLACACLTMTCLELSTAEEVTVTSGERSITMTRDSFLLSDGTAVPETTMEETK